MFDIILRNVSMSKVSSSYRERMSDKKNMAEMRKRIDDEVADSYGSTAHKALLLGALPLAAGAANSMRGKYKDDRKRAFIRGAIGTLGAGLGSLPYAHAVAARKIKEGSPAGMLLAGSGAAAGLLGAKYLANKLFPHRENRGKESKVEDA